MNKFKILKPIISLLLIIVIVFAYTPKVYASLASSAQGESGYAPRPPTPPNAPATKPQSPSSSSSSDDDDSGGGGGPPVIRKTYFEFISGNIREDLGYDVGQPPSGTTTGNSSKTVESPSLPIKGVKVVLKSGNKEVASTRTDSSGNYCFYPENDGEYSTEFWYGDYDAGDPSSLKYNGHDYYTIEVPQEDTYIAERGTVKYKNATEYEVITSGKGAAQVFLAVDCSLSMRDPHILIDGKTKLAYAVEKTKKLVDSLLEGDRNIYVGLIFFSGTNYRAVSLTKDKDILYTALDVIRDNGWQTANTDIASALDNANDSFYVEDPSDSNRYIMLISDGIPTKYKGTQVYCDETEQATLNKLYNIISPGTRDKVQSLKDSGIKMISLFIKSDDPEENQLIEDTFKESSSVFANLGDDYEIEEFITEFTKEYVINSTVTKEYTTEKIEILSGYEDPQMRAEVDANFDHALTYSDTYPFSVIDDPSTGDGSVVSARTKMRIVGGQGYKINRLTEEEKKINEALEASGAIVIVERTGYPNQNVALTRRPQSSVSLTTTITNLDIVLQNHLRLSQNIPSQSDIPLVETIDKELSYGSTLEAEYTVQIVNDSSVQYNYMELLNVLPDEFALDEVSAFLVKIVGSDSSSQTHEEYTALKLEPGDVTTIDDLSTLIGSQISNEFYENYKDRNVIKIRLKNNESDGNKENGFYLPPRGECRLTIRISKVMSTIYDKIELDSDITEVLSYEDNFVSKNGKNTNRRMTDLTDEETAEASATTDKSAEVSEVTTISAVTPTNAKSSLGKGMFPGDDKQKDKTSFTNTAYVLPPTGEDLSNSTVKLIIIILIPIAFIITIILLKLKSNKRKMSTE